MENYYDDMEDSMVPERDGSNGGGGGSPGEDILGDHHQSSMIMKGSTVAAFNQQRTVVAKLSRGEIEDRYLRLLEENIVLKKHAVKQDEKIKKLATKLIRVMSDKKRLEMGGGSASGAIRGHRDLETEELIEDQQQRIRELERTNHQLKDKLMVAKQQIMSVQQQSSSSFNKAKRTHKSVSSLNFPASPHPAPSSIMMHSPTPTSQQQLLSQQAQNLLEEARNENRMLEESVTMLKEQVNMFELEVEQIQEQAKIKESNFEEEIGMLKDQLKERNYQDVAENIELIRLQQDKKAKMTQLSTMKAQIQGLEEQVHKLKSEADKLKNENTDMSTAFAEEQRKSIHLSSELSNNSSSKQALLEAEEKSRDLQKENAILRESNAKLLDSAYNVERERQFAASENALKVQVAQLEATLKADLNDKRLLSEALANERENLAKIESEFQELQSKYFNLKETMEGHEEKLKFFAHENSVDAGELEQALLYLRQRSSNLPTKSGANASFPDFLETSKTFGDDSNSSQNDSIKQLRSELSEVQSHHVEAVNELEKTRSLLRVQANINLEQKNEIEALQQRLLQVKSEFQGQIGEYKKIFDMKAARIHKLEMQLRESTYGQVSKNVNVNNLMSQTVHTPSGQSLFEIHILQANLTKEFILKLGTDEPQIFATWTFYEHDMQYTPVIKGSKPHFDCSAYYKVKLDDPFLDFLMDSSVMVELHMTPIESSECKTIGQAELKLAEVVHYPSNKLHGSVLIQGEHGQGPVIGSLDYWFKLHTAATSRIQEWLDHREDVQRAIEKSEQAAITSEINLLNGERRKLILPKNQEKMEPRRKKISTPEMTPAPRVKPQEANSENKIELSEKSTLTSPPKKTKKSSKQKITPEGTEAKDQKGEKSEIITENSNATTKVGGKQPDIEHQRTESEVEQQIEKETDVNIVQEKKEEKIANDEEKNSPKKVASTESTNKKLKLRRQKSEVVGPSPKKLDAEVDKPVPKPRGPSKVVSKPQEESIGTDNEITKAKSDWDSEDEKTDSMHHQPIGSKRPDVHQLTGSEDEDSESVDEDESDDEVEDEEESAEEADESDENDSDEESEEESDEDEESDPDSKKSEPEEADHETETELSAPEPEIKKVVKSSTEDGTTTTSGESSSTTHDSEGVVVRKESIGGSRSSVMGNEAITVTVSEFKAGKNASFLKNKKIEKLFVEYRFLDLKPEETETPFALPKPKSPGETIVFNFSKVIPMDKTNQNNRRRLLTKILNQETTSVSKDDPKNNLSKEIIFNLVSEPDEGKDGKCEDVGAAVVDLENLYKTGEDLVDAVLDVQSAEPQTRVSKFLGSKKTIGTLTVSILASDVFKSLKPS